MDGVEEPQGGVGGVIEPLLGAFRKHVRDEAVANVVAERAQDVAGLALASRAERQPFEADHRVAAPVGEPVVAGDDRADLVAHRPRPRGLLDAAGRRDDELIGGQDEFGRRTGGRHLLRGLDQTAAPAALGVPAVPPGSAPRWFPTIRSTRRAFPANPGVSVSRK